MLMPRAQELREIPISQIEFGGDPQAGSPQLQWTGLEDLMASIKQFGLLQPIVACEIGEGKYRVVAGRRRLMAHVALRVPHIAAVILDEIPEPDLAGAIRATENLVRRDVDRAEMAATFAALLRRFGSPSAIVEETGLPLEIVQRYI